MPPDDIRIHTGAEREVTLHAALGDAPIGTGEDGKPRIDGGPFFSLSHTAGLVVVAVSAQREVGVDVERVRPVRHAERVAARWLPPEVAEVVAAAERPDEAFLGHWTRAEALLKATGQPLGTPAGEGWAVEPIEVGEGYVAALAWSTSASSAQSTAVAPK